MIRGLGRLLLLRFLPRRLLPVLTAWEILQIVRHRRRTRAAALEAEADDDARRTQPPPTPRTRRRS
jgi:hypothetical protein